MVVKQNIQEHILCQVFYCQGLFYFKFCDSLWIKKNQIVPYVVCELCLYKDKTFLLFLYSLVSVPFYSVFESLTKAAFIWSGKSLI